ncbi:MAG: hypothetical protein Q7R41_20420, partial [Phycisphaerales bacterium]|nr:hypothetical protein [Phycisphaerales bacterium]
GKGGEAVVTVGTPVAQSSHQQLRDAPDTMPCISKLSVTGAVVAQSCTLPFRRFVICETSTHRGRRVNPTPSRLQVGDTAECNSALQATDNLGMHRTPRHGANS